MGILAGYDTAIGNKWEVVYDLPGPASYATGGETITAAQFGHGGIEFVVPVQWTLQTVNSQLVVVPTSMSGNYFVGIKFTNTSLKDQAVASVTLQWYVTSTGAEVAASTSLSGEHVRLKIRLV